MPKQHMIAQIDLEMLDNDFQKYHVTRLWCPLEDKLHFTVRAFRAIFDPLIMGSKLLSFDEAVLRAEKGTSPGFLFKELGCTTKRQVFEKHLPELRKKVERVFAGESVETIWQSSPKVEIRTLEKLFNDVKEKRKQRTFMCCDTLCYIVALMLYGDQNDKLLDISSSNHWSAVGLSIFHGGWHDLATLLTRRKNSSGRVLCFDISAMEASISPWLFEFLYSWRNAAIIGNVDAKTWFKNNKIYSLVLDVFGWLGMKIGGNPSGCLNTLTDNTFMVIFVLLYNLCCQTDSLEQVLAWYDDLPVKAMGDDTIMEDDPLWDPLIENSKTLGFQMEYEAPPPTTLAQAKFLNFGFSYNAVQGMYSFKPNFDKMFANLFFNRKSNSWRLTLAKLYALRVMCYCFPDRRMELENYICYVWDNFEPDMRNEVSLDDKLPFNSLRCMHLQDSEIQFLIYGLESGTNHAICDSFVQLCNWIFEE